MYALNITVFTLFFSIIPSVHMISEETILAKLGDETVVQQQKTTREERSVNGDDSAYSSEYGNTLEKSKFEESNMHNTRTRILEPASLTSLGSVLNINILQTVLQNPQLMSLLLKHVGNSTEVSFPAVLQGMTVPFGLENTQLLSMASMLEDFMSGLKYILSPEGLASHDQCSADFSAYVQGLQNTQMWALQMFDASGKLSKSILEGALRFLGNYDECLEISHKITNNNTGSDHVIKGNYCRLMFNLPPSIINATSGKMPFSVGVVTLQWDLCLPMSCNDSQVADAVSILPLNATGISLESATFVKQKDWKKDKLAIATVVVLCVIVFLTVLGTLYDVISSEIRTYREKKDNESGMCINNGFVFDHGHLDPNLIFKNGEAGHTIETEKINQRLDELEGERFGRQLLLSFALHKNTEKILNTKTGEGNLGCIHGIRVLSMAWVILGHSMTWDGMKSWENMVDYANWMRRFTMQFLANGTLSVDTFFVLSGCLVTYLFLKEHKKSRRPTVGQMVLYYVHRYWRLTPFYLVIILCYMGLLDYLIDGPMAWAKDIDDKDNCRAKWWTNILYFNNFYSFSEMCIPASWFLAHDMQFYVIAPVALLPLAYGVSWLGYIVMFLMLATHISMYGYLEWQTGGSTQFVNNGASMERIYRMPWCRVGVFAIGMFLGVILYRTKCIFKMRRFKLLLCWVVFLTIGLLCTYVTYDDYRQVPSKWDGNTRIIHETLYRPAWGVFVSWVIFVCCTGHGGFINSILSWSAWMPLGRLTYGAYLLHPILLSYTEFSVRSLRYADIPYVSYHFLGTFAVSYALAFLTCVLVESPCMALEKAVLNKLKINRR